MNALQEAVVGAVTAGPLDLQASVVEWVLAGVRAEWTSPVWQAHLGSPQAFMQRYTPVEADGAGGWQVGAGSRGGGARGLFQEGMRLGGALAGETRGSSGREV